MLVPGHLAGLVAVQVQVALVRDVEVAGRDKIGLVVLDLVGKEFDQTEKNPRGTIYAFSSTCLEEVALFWVH